MGNLRQSDEDGYAGMSGLTSFNRVEGEFFLKEMPLPDSQTVTRTVQGINDRFTYGDDDPNIASMISENDQVIATEMVYSGGIDRVQNKTLTTYGLDSSSDPINRIVTNAGVGEYNSVTGSNMPSSVHDEIVAIAVDDVKPFMLKSLDIGHRANIVNDKPTNDAYIRHLTPSTKTRIAHIVSPSILTSNGGPSKILVYYDAIDLTGEIVAGTGMTRSEVNTHFQANHVEGDAAYLIVKKMVPAATTIYSISGTERTLSDIIRKPYSSAPGTHSDVQLTVVAPGGVVSIPTFDLKRPLSDYSLSSLPSGGITPSVFIDSSDCVRSVGTGLQGYGRPRAIASTNVPDPTTNEDYHTATIYSTGGNDQTDYAATSVKPSAFARSNLIAFDVIDNEVISNEHLILVQPKDRDRFDGLGEVITLADSSDFSVFQLEMNQVRGRVEEIEPRINEGGQVEIRGRSHLMDIADQRAERDFDLSTGTPIKEVGDLGTPTVSLSLGGIGQGGADITPEFTEHPIFGPFKDRIVSSGNASVRNDAQTSTMYASTRALVELPLFPSMFFDTEKRLSSSTDKGDPLPSAKSMELNIDCTMTAMNRPQMMQHESRYSIDWGMHDPVAAFEVTERWEEIASGNYVIRCQRPSVQAVITSTNSGASQITVDDATAFSTSAESHATLPYFLTIGEGILGTNTLGYVCKATVLSTNTFTLTTVYDPADGSTVATATAINAMFAGMTVTLGGYLVTHSSTADIKFDVATDQATTATNMAAAIRACLGKGTNDVEQDPNNTARYYIKNGPNMSAFEFDILEEYEANNDRPLVQPIECYHAALSLKGKKADGSALEYVRPLILNCGTIASAKLNFTDCVEEVIRNINLAGHPKAVNSNSASAFDPPNIFTGTTGDNTGSHMGYVRAFMGSEVESRDGEKGQTIVIHSTIPGATGRNFCVWLKNRSPYAYRPVQAFGTGGLLTTNSRMYQTNSFPAPLPIGYDGETRVPITTFTGPVHGRTIDEQAGRRHYNGVGSTFTVKTVTSPTNRNLASTYASGTVEMAADGSGNTPNSSAFSGSTLSHLAVESKVIDYLMRASRVIDSSNPGIISINGRKAQFTSISRISSASLYGSNCAFIKGVTPTADANKFFDELFTSTGQAAGAPAFAEVSVEIIEPRIDTDAILFFGGGHTGLTFDISDGTANDYSSHYTHHYANGPTGFSGFQNIGDVSTAATVLDFTEITNEDTINANTLQGMHLAGALEPPPVSYVRFNEDYSSAGASTGAAYDSDIEITDLLFNSPVSTFSSAGLSAPIAGPATADATSKGHKIGFGDLIGLSRTTTGPVTKVRNPYFDDATWEPHLNGFTVSAFIKPISSGATDYMCGPLVHGITTDGFPWGVHIGGGQGVTADQDLTIAITSPNILTPSTKVYAGVLAGTTLPYGKLQVAKSGWTYICAGWDPGSGGPPQFFLYVGNTAGNGVSSAALGNPGVGIVNLTDFCATVQDQHYGAGATSPNVKASYLDKTDGYAGGDADHPQTAFPSSGSAPYITPTGRDRKMILYGSALHGAPYIDVSSQATYGGATFSLTDYFIESTGSSATQTYGDTNGSGATGTNHAGPIFFRNGAFSEVSIFQGPISFETASAIFNSRTVW